MESAIAEICISELPGNALCKILSNLSFGDKIQAQRVCKLWHGVLRQPVESGAWGEVRLDAAQVSAPFTPPDLTSQSVNMSASTAFCRWLSERARGSVKTGFQLKLSLSGSACKLRILDSPLLRTALSGSLQELHLSFINHHIPSEKFAAICQLTKLQIGAPIAELSFSIRVRHHGLLLGPVPQPADWAHSSGAAAELFPRPGL
ncbi:hypothetical protein WJX73_001829 [Symbiochloris irregularis]|uniref:F-box domain-containing protein n=1 Tax=Symbiochloris irregularis TaxID=706552 RepID=A0AAW1NNP9_9CHLO